MAGAADYLHGHYPMLNNKVNVDLPKADAAVVIGRRQQGRRD